MSEDATPYPCGPVRDTILDTFARTIKFDGGVDAVFTHRTQQDTVAGTVWRFILNENKTLVAVPYQSPHAPAKALHCIPQRIESILGGPLAPSTFGFAICHAARAMVKNVDHPCEAGIHEVIEAELQAWKAGQKLPALKQFEKDRAEAIQDRAERWKAAGLSDDSLRNNLNETWLAQRAAITREVSARHNLPYDDEAGNRVQPDRMIAVDNDRAALAKRQGQIETRRRKRSERAEAKRTAEREEEALSELGRALSATGSRPPEKAKLRALFNFIREDICRGNAINPIIRGADLWRVLEKVQELTGENITESVFLEYSPGMKHHVDELAKQTAEVEKIDEAEARRCVFDCVRFVAVFEDGSLALVQSITRCVHDEKDAELFRPVTPGIGMQMEIGKRVERLLAESRNREAIAALAASKAAATLRAVK